MKENEDRKAGDIDPGPAPDPGYAVPPGSGPDPSAGRDGDGTQVLPGYQTRLVKHYRLLHKIGEGGMGEVHAAEDTKLNRTVALKFLPVSNRPDSIAEARFMTEARAASALDHPNIGVIHEIDRDPDGRLFIVMARYEGGSLKEKLSSGPLDIRQALDLTCQITRGLAAAHRKRIVHRDLKPANIMLTADGDARIIDFGIAKLAHGSDLTVPGKMLGTIGYMSPEQIRGEDVDARSDIYSLGTLCYRMLTGSLPFPNQTDAGLINAIQNAEPRPLSEHPGDYPDGLQRILDRCLAKDPDDRYASAVDLLRDLHTLQDLVCGLRTGEIAAPARARGAGRRFAPGAVIVILALLLGYQYLDRGAGNAPPALAVFDFKDVGTGDPNLSANLTNLVSIGMVENCPVRVISPEFLYDLQRRRFDAARGPIGDGQALAIARESGASLLLSGQVGDLDGERFMTIRLVGTKTGETLMARRFVGTGLTRLADEAIEAVLPPIASASGRTLAATRTATGQLTTSSPQAYRYDMAGVTALDARKPREAIANLHKAVDLDSTFALALLELSRIYYSNVGAGVEYGRARTFAERAWTLKAHLGVKDRMALEAWRQRLDYRVTDAIATYRRMLERWPDDRDILQDLLNSYFYHFYFRESLDVARQGLRHFPDDLNFALYYQICLGHLGRLREALQATRANASRHPREPNSWDELGIRFLSLGQPDSAEAAFRKALDLDPDFHASKRGLIFAEYARGDLDAAIDATRRLLETETLLPGQIVHLLIDNAFWPGETMFLAEQGRFAEALAVFDEASRHVSDPVSALRLETSRSRLLMRMGRYRDVLDWSRDAPLRSDSRLADMLEIRFGALALVAMDSLSRAEAYRDRLRATEPGWGGVARYQATLVDAKINLAAGRTDDALADLERLRSYGVPDGGYFDIELREIEARALAMAGRPAEAERVLLDLLGVYRGHALAHLDLGRLYEAGGRYADAARECRAFLEAWSKADPELPQLEEARARLERTARRGTP